MGESGLSGHLVCLVYLVNKKQAIGKSVYLVNLVHLVNLIFLVDLTLKGRDAQEMQDWLIT